VIAPEVGTVIGGLRIDAVAGRGGMGVVYRAHELALDRTVAMKIVNPELANDPEFRERFRREARLAAALDHPHVVPIYRAGEDDGNLYLTMRYVEGTDLAAMITDHGRIEPRAAVEIISQVASALDAAHQRGLVHRDVKPANVLVTQRDGKLHTYLTDFGISKDANEDGMTKSGVVVGSLSYIAPEQLAGDRADGRADVYSLGCVLFQALTGDVPFPRTSTAAQMFAHLNAPPPPLGEKVPALRGPLEQVVAKALAKRPQDRYATAGEFGRAAQAAMNAARVPPTQVQPQYQPQNQPQYQPPYRPPSQPSSQPRPPSHPNGPAHPSFPSGQQPQLAFTGAPQAPARKRRSWLTVGVAAAVAAVIALAVVIVVTNRTGSARPPVPPAVVLPATGQLVGNPIKVGAGPVAVKSGGNFLWTANNAGGSVSRVDPATGASVEIKVGGQPNNLVVGPKTVWVFNYLRSFTPIDIATGKPGTLVDTGLDFDDITASETRIWVAAADKATIASFDIATGKPAGAPIAAGKRPASIAVGGGKVYVVDTASRALLVYDENSGAPVGAPVSLPDGITVVGYEAGHVYLGGKAGFLLYAGGSAVTAAQIVPFDCSCGVIGGATTSWLYDSAGTVQAYSPDLRTATGAPLTGLATGLSDAVYVGGKLWLVNRGGDTVQAVQPAG
jgi:serine/threonine protein kinase